jgi:UDP-N-acetylglucosamine acyltransferase
MDAIKSATPEAVQDVDFMQSFLASASNGITR